MGSPQNPKQTAANTNKPNQTAEGTPNQRENAEARNAGILKQSETKNR